MTAEETILGEIAATWLLLATLPPPMQLPLCLHLLQLLRRLGFAL